MPPTTLGTPTLVTPTPGPYLAAGRGGGACLGASPGAEPRAPAAQGMRSAFYSASQRRGGARSHIPGRYRALPAPRRLHPGTPARRGHPWAMWGAPHEPVAPHSPLGCPGQGGEGRLGLVVHRRMERLNPAAPQRPLNPHVTPPGTFYAPSLQDHAGDSAPKCHPSPQKSHLGVCGGATVIGVRWEQQHSEPTACLL